MPCRVRVAATFAERPTDIDDAKVGPGSRTCHQPWCRDDRVGGRSHALEGTAATARAKRSIPLAGERYNGPRSLGDLPMRYLYGDSAPFPHGYDFLATLQRFLEEAARTVSLTSEMAALVEARVASERTRVRALADLEALHATLVADLEAGAMRLAGELAPDYAGRIRDEAGRAVEAARAQAGQREDHERRALETELAQRHELARQALEGFFLSARMPILAATIRMDLEGQSPRMSAELVHEGGIVAAVTLAASRAHDWVAPRRAGDFAPELSMLIGLKKGCPSPLFKSLSLSDDCHSSSRGTSRLTNEYCTNPSKKRIL